MAHTILVIPCYNEASRLDIPTIERFVMSNTQVNLLFVNDGSNDNTFTVLKTLEQNHPDRVTVLDLPHNMGKHQAVRQGMLMALNQAEYVGYWDADLSTPLNEVSQFSDEFSRFPSLQIVMGSRVKIMGRHIERKRTRHYIGRVFATFVSILLKTPFYDTQCGAKLFKVTDTLSDILQNPFKTSWIFDVELLQRFMAHPNITSQSDVSELIHEIALNHWVDVPGSKLKLRDFVFAAKDLIKLYWLKS
ncbi:MAG TPA: family 2 glycosyl transferase [Phycisphaerales bacterium]|nr:family 2 glycosyl transferase [Phycisphaerales bacterium]